jgi:hypothetical protein
MHGPAEGAYCTGHNSTAKEEKVTLGGLRKVSETGNPSKGLRVRRETSKQRRGKWEENSARPNKMKNRFNKSSSTRWHGNGGHLEARTAWETAGSMSRFSLAAFDQTTRVRVQRAFRGS